MGSDLEEVAGSYFLGECCMEDFFFCCYYCKYLEVHTVKINLLFRFKIRFKAALTTKSL